MAKHLHLKKKIIGILNVFNFTYVIILEIEASKTTSISESQSSEEWFDTELACLAIEKIKAIKKLEILKLDVVSINTCFNETIQRIVQQSQHSLNDVIIKSKKTTLMHTKDGDENDVSQHQNWIDSFCADILKSLKQSIFLIDIAFVGKKCLVVLNGLKERKIEYREFACDVIDCNILQDIVCVLPDDVKRVTIREYVMNWDPYMLTELFCSVPEIGIPLGRTFPIVGEALVTKELKIFVNENQTREMVEKIEDICATIPKVNKLTIWNTGDASNVNQWWIWIPYALSSYCKELVLRQTIVADVINMLSKHYFSNIEKLSIVNPPRGSKKQIKKVAVLLPQHSCFQVL